MSQNAPTVLIMGPPGAGKGTQSAHLVERYSLRHVATGDVLRAAVADGTELGRAAKQYMDRGALVPDDVIIGMLRDLVSGLATDEGVLLDGFPRTVAQADALGDMLAELERDISAVLDVRVPADVLLERLSSRWICRSCQTPFNVNTRPPAREGVCDRCGGELYQRDDDKPAAVSQRLKVYEADTAPVSAYYEHRDLLTVVDGNQPPEAVEAAIDAVMERAAVG
jgi:adenylate kinase